MIHSWSKKALQCGLTGKISMSGLSTQRLQYCVGKGLVAEASCLCAADCAGRR